MENKVHSGPQFNTDHQSSTHVLGLFQESISRRPVGGKSDSTISSAKKYTETKSSGSSKTPFSKKLNNLINPKHQHPLKGSNKATGLNKVTDTVLTNDKEYHLQNLSHFKIQFDGKLALKMPPQMISWLLLHGHSKWASHIQVTKLVPEYQRAMDEDATRLLYDTLSTFHNAMAAHGIDYFICGGTLLGSYRHHGIIPWDDDADVYLKLPQARKAAIILTGINNYTLVTNTIRWKFFPDQSKDIKGRTWKFPFLDISLIKDADLMLFDADPSYGRQFHYSHSWIYPLILRPFGPLKLFAPFQYEKVLKKNYMVDACDSASYNHRLEKAVPISYSIPCELLQNTYEFVHRTTIPGGVNETLWSNGKLVHWHFQPEYVAESHNDYIDYYLD